MAAAGNFSRREEITISAGHARIFTEPAIDVEYAKRMTLLIGIRGR